MDVNGASGEVRASFRAMPPTDQLKNVFGVSRQSGSRKVYVASAINPSSLFRYARVIVARFHPDNTVDPAFGVDGLAEVSFEGTELSQGIIGSSMAVHTDGGVAVLVRAIVGPDRGPIVALVRFNRDGDLDADFGIGGLRVHNFSDLAYFKQSAGAAQPALVDVLNVSPVQTGATITSASGKFFFVSQTSSAPGPSLVVRFLPSGELDTSFGNDGVIQIVVPGYEGDYVFLQGVTELSNGQIAICGGVKIYADSVFMSEPKGLVLKLNDDGSCDPSFGNQGLVMIDLPENLSGKDYSTIYYFQSVAEASDNCLVCSGEMSTYTGGVHSSKGVVVKLEGTGLPDTSFNSGKVVVFGAQGEFLAFVFAGWQSNGKVVVAGSVSEQNLYVDPASAKFIVARFNPDGAADVSFARRGWNTASFGPGVNLASAMRLEADSIILAGKYGQKGAVSETVVISFYT